MSVDTWMIVLGAIAAVGSLVSVGFLIVGAVARHVERPIADLHVSIVKDRPGFTEQMRAKGKHVMLLNIVSMGDAVITHVEVRGNFTILRHHEQERLAVLAPGQMLSLPISVPLEQSTIEGEIVYTTGRGRRLKAGSHDIRARWKSPSDRADE